MIPVPDKSDLVAYATTFHQTGNAVEVGVFDGQFAEQNLKVWTGNYYMVDTWGHRNDGTVDKNDDNPAYWSEIMNRVYQRCAFAKKRIVIDRGYSVDRAKHYTDGFFDWVFIDAGHDYQNFKADLNAWWPKLRKGGMFSGDDYGNKEDVNGFSADRWETKLGVLAKAFNWGVIAALDEFCAENSLDLHVTWLNDKNIPCWYIIK